MATQDPNDNTQVEDNNVDLNNSSQVADTNNDGDIGAIVDDIIAKEAPQTNKQQGNQQQVKPPVVGAKPNVGDKTPIVDPLAQQQQTRIPLRNIPGAFVDTQGNVVDFAGRPLGRSGAERRLIEQASGPMKTVMERLQKAEEQNELFNRAHSISADNKLTPAEVMLGHQLAAAWKKDPGKTINYLLQQAKEQGITVEGMSNANAIDIPAIANVIEERLKAILSKFDPVFTEWDKDRQRREMDSKVDSEVEEFFHQYPDAKVHETEVAEVMEKSGYQLTMHQAYTLLLRYSAENQLDWSKPLRPQVEGRSNTDGNQTRRAPTGQRRELPPMGGGGNSSTPRVKNNASRNDDSFEAIFAEVKQELGI